MRENNNVRRTTELIFFSDSIHAMPLTRSATADLPYTRSKKRRTRRRRGWKNRSALGKPSRGLRQSRYMFKRTTSTLVSLDDAPGGSFATSDGGIYRNWVFAINDTGLNATNLLGAFKRYRINAVSMKMFFSNTQSSAGMMHDQNTMEFMNSQLLVYTVPNRSGVDDVPTETTILNTQAKKVRTAINGGRPLNLYMKVNQLSETYAGVANSDYTTVRPQFIGTSETACPHYGLTMFIKRADGAGLTTGFLAAQKVNIQVTYYLEFTGAI